MCGGDCIGMGLGQLYSPMQTSVVDGAEANLPTPIAQNHHLVAEHFPMTEHSIIPALRVLAKISWSTLSADGQAR